MVGALPDRTFYYWTEQYTTIFKALNYMYVKKKYPKRILKGDLEL